MANKDLKKILQVSYEAKACHIGSALSCSSILDEIFKLKKKKDIFIFAKASGIAAYYCKFFTKKQAVEYLKKYPLPSKEVPGIIHSMGSMGHGLPVAVGMAYADRTRDVYVLISDGEIQEGTTWESILFARQHKLKNLKIYVDKNEYQACGKTEDILGVSAALNMLKILFPLEIRYTTKGPLYGGVEWHYKNLDEKGLKEALLQVSERNSKG